MNDKWLVGALMVLSLAYQVFLNRLSVRSAKNSIPDNVKDIYDEVTYQKWQRYHREKNRNDLFMTLISFALQAVMMFAGVYAAAVAHVENVYAQTLIVVSLLMVADTVICLPFAWTDTMKIEQRYGFNKATAKTFAADQVKNLIISLLMMNGLMCLLALIHRAMGDWMLVLFTAALALVMLCMTFLAPVFNRIFNKFTPLEDGALKTKLTALLESHGYHVKSIEVMDASRRTTKSNAYFTGFGKMKTIVLYDTLLSSMDEDEICAVFSHEMGHGLHRDTLKMNGLNLLNFAMLAVLLWLAVRTPGVHIAFGFAGVNYGFAFVLLSMALGVFQSLTQLCLCAYSRRAEYRADRQAVAEGYAEPLTRALRKLQKDNFGDPAPSPLLVALTYTHPPLSERLKAIEGE